MKIKYKKCGDYYIPCLKLPKVKNEKPLGKFGIMRLEYLRQHRKAQYTIMLMNEELSNHLISIDNQAKDMYELLIKQLAEKENITEELKQTDPMKWVQMMNNISNAAKEIVLAELIYN